MATGGGPRRVPRRGKAKKKTKYLSLSRHLTKAVDLPESNALECSPPSASASVEEAVETPPPEHGGHGGEQQQQQQLEAFSLHHEAPSTLFAAAPSLTDILGASSSAGGGGREESSCGASPDVSPGGTGRFTGEEEDLARRALRGRERWVYCRSSSSSTPSAATTPTSSSCSSAASTGASARSPLLKLDYEEILAAWAGRGSLYIDGAAASHAAPELELDSVFVEVGPSTRHVGAWSARETPAGRAERVRRYREKRRGRLFEKRIRYEVRRLNAVRRPRLKGRFIKEKEGAAMADGGDLQPTS